MNENIGHSLMFSINIKLINMYLVFFLIKKLTQQFLFVLKNNKYPTCLF